MATLVLWALVRGAALHPVLRTLDVPRLTVLLGWLCLPLLFGCWMIETAPDRRIRVVRIVLVALASMVAGRVLMYLEPRTAPPTLGWLIPAFAVTGIVAAYAGELVSSSSRYSVPLELSLTNPRTLLFAAAKWALVAGCLFASSTALAWGGTQMALGSTRVRRANAILFVLKSCGPSQRLLSEYEALRKANAHVDAVVVWAGDPAEVSLRSAFLKGRPRPAVYPTVVTAGGTATGWREGVALLRGLNKSSRRLGEGAVR